MITIQDCIELTEKYIFEKRIGCYDRSEFSDPEKIADDEKSDIYSFGVILWEISSGRPPFRSFTSKEAIAIHIFQGKREKPIEDTPQTFVKLYTECWDEDPVNRPEAKSVLKTLNLLIFNISNPD
ncbi:kinase-like domain-containing protein [Gigaspora margarita]|uniref:Kinase-like domain-containing protein n=1 Tax=Gigaspora margarita TaxID=4874 RepID=A0A8H4A8G6_GIGMA|nr:kinase-like domain-containing protein [Gigaspora margarita]